MALTKVDLKSLDTGTDGQIITYDASGDPTAVGPGTDGQVLTSTGAGSPPAFEDLPTSGATLTGSTNNTVCTVTGANAIQGESNVHIDGSGRILVGTIASRTVWGNHNVLQVEGLGGGANGVSITRNTNDASYPYIAFGKSRGTSDGSSTIVADDDVTGVISFNAADGGDMNPQTAYIQSAVDGTPGANDMPGRLQFFTTSDGSYDSAERVRIDASGRTLFKGDSTGGTSGLGGFGSHSWEPKVQVLHNQGAVSVRDGDSEWGGSIHIAKCRGTYASPTTSANNDRAGGVYYSAHDGTDFQNYVAGIEAFVDGAVASNDTPGRLVFSTAADGANTLTERLRIDSNGYVTKPGNVSFRATNLNNSTSNTTISDENQIFYATDWNIGSAYDTSNGKFTAPVAGKYYFNAHIIYNTTGATTHAVYWKRNGSRFMDQHFCSVGGQWDGMSYTALMNMAANDYMEFQHSAAATHGGSWSHLIGWLVQ